MSFNSMVDRMPQILDISPSRELIFKGPFNDVVVSHIHLTNPTDKPVCYKVKTTAPKQYCVRPNCGVIAPKFTKDVDILLQPMSAETMQETNRHKFMIQACYAPDEFSGIDDIWSTKDPLELPHTKLTVRFVDGEVPGDVHRTRGSLAHDTRDNDQSTQSGTDDTMAEKLLQENSSLNNEIQALQLRNARLQKEHDRMHMEIGIPTIQVFLATIAALLIGLIIGRLF